MSAANQLHKLLKQTEDSINQNKDYRFKIQKSMPDNLKKDYYEKYLSKSLGDRSVKTVWGKTTKRDGTIKDVEVKYEAMPVHHYNTLLAMAFNKAHEFYKTIREKIKVKASDKEEEIILPGNETEEESKGEISSLSAAECLIMSRQLKQGKNSTLVKTIKQGDLQMLNEFRKIEELSAKVLEELRNYHAHVFHEPGPVYFDNFYGDDYKPAKKLSKQEWQTARDYFENLFNDVRSHLLKTVETQLVTYKDDSTAITEIQKVKKRLEEHEFQENGLITHNALLFIACYFLRKSDANFFIKKWTGVKKAEGFSKTSQTFFNYYSLKDSKSLYAVSSDIFKFRQLIGILGTMPVLKNDCFKPFYELIKKHNDFYGAKLDETNDRKKKEELQVHIIPIRKSQNYTPWYMGYLKEKGLLNDFKIAFYKLLEDRGEFLEESNIRDGMSRFKERMKMATGTDKKAMTGIYKEAKRNFLFKKADTNDDNFCTKKENAIVKYVYMPENGSNEIEIQVNLSPALLMKWVFADIILGKGDEVRQTIVKFIRAYYELLSVGKITDDLMGLPAFKIFPVSLLKTTETEPAISITTQKAKGIIQGRRNTVQKFIDENESKRAPWKFAAKRKIDIIFDYVNLKYSGNAYDQGKDEATKRHECLSDMEYLDALELIRFYGKEYQSEAFKKLFKDDKRVYFNPLIKYFESKECSSLEKLFKAVSEDYIKYLLIVESKLNNDSLKKFVKVFKMNKPSRKSDIGKHALRFATNQSLHPDLVNIQNLTTGNADYMNWKAANALKDEKRVTDFSLMRHILSKDKPFTNTDYMMQCIMPVLFKRDMLPSNKEGKIQGNTSLFNGFMSSKTEELILWNIANYYWKKANGKDNSANENVFLQKNDSERIQPAYRHTSIYNQIYKNLIDIKLQRERNGVVSGPVYSVQIKPTKFDDEFQHYKQNTLVDYIELCMTEEEKAKQPWQFEDMNKLIQDKLIKYLDDVYLILTIEKEVVKKNMDTLKDKFKVTAKGELPGIYLFFGRTNTAGENNLENVICNLIYDELSTIRKLSFSHKDLIYYRNMMMHQHLLKEDLHMSVRKVLFEYCQQKGLLKPIGF